MIEDYRGAVNGQQVTCRVMYVKRKDVAVAVLCIGNEKGFNETLLQDTLVGSL